MHPAPKKITRRPAMKVAVEDRGKQDDYQIVAHDCFFVDAAIDRLIVHMERANMLIVPGATFDPSHNIDTWLHNAGRGGGGELLNTVSACVGTRISPQMLLERRNHIAGQRVILNKLLENPGIAQRTPEWYAARNDMVSSSDAAQSLGCAKFGNQREFFRKKAGLPEEQAPFDGSCPPLKWGVMYEPIAQALYSAVNADVRVHEFGLLRHPTLDFIGASPDGITETGVMVEIKCPYRRKIVPGQVPTQYYYQIQGQLAVCGLDQCDFWEVEIEESYIGPEDPEWIAAEAEGGAEYGRGVVLETGTEKAPEFIYPDPVVGGSPETLLAWIEEMKNKPDSMDGKRWITHWWYIRRRGTTRVPYDPAFCEDMFSRLGQVWQRVLEYRADRERYLREVGVGTIYGSSESGQEAFNEAPLMIPVALSSSPKLKGCAFLDDD